MLTPGNHKLGGSRIWGFGLPSGTRDVCPGISDVCQRHCYALALERYRPAAAAKYRRNFVLTRRRDFVPLVRAFLVLHRVRVVRVHLGGDFFSARYARKWLSIMRRSPRTLFYFYTRSWRICDIKTVIDRMADLPNCRVWYSVDSTTGIPADVPLRVRLAWLMATSEDTPPTNTHLVFRIRRLRRLPLVGLPVCPTEDGIVRTPTVTCDRCGYCWHPGTLERRALPLIDPPPQQTCSRGGECDGEVEKSGSFPTAGSD